MKKEKTQKIPNLSTKVVLYYIDKMVKEINEVWEKNKLFVYMHWNWLRNNFTTELSGLNKIDPVRAENFIIISYAYIFPNIKELEVCKAKQEKEISDIIGHPYKLG